MIDWVREWLGGGGPLLIHDLGDLGVVMFLGTVIGVLLCVGSVLGTLRSFREDGDLTPAAAGVVGSAVGLPWLFRVIGDEGAALGDFGGFVTTYLLIFPLGVAAFKRFFGRPGSRTDITFHWIRVVVFAFLSLYLIDLAWWAANPDLTWPVPFASGAELTATIELVYFVAALLSLVAAYVVRLTSRSRTPKAPGEA